MIANSQAPLPAQLRSLGQTGAGASSDAPAPPYRILAVGEHPSREEVAALVARGMCDRDLGKHFGRGEWWALHLRTRYFIAPIPHNARRRRYQALAEAMPRQLRKMPAGVRFENVDRATLIAERMSPAYRHMPVLGGRFI